MKKWIPLLLLSLALAGCGDEKEKQQANSEAKVKTRSERKENKVQTLALKNMDKNKRDVVLFINRAEHLAEHLQYEAANLSNGRKVVEDGLVYRELPQAFNTREKIVNHFARFWSRPLAENLYDYLNTRIVNGRVYLAPDDSEYPMLISSRNTFVTNKDDELIAVVNEITLPSYAQDRTVRYRLVRDKKTKLFEINKREGTYGSELYK